MRRIDNASSNSGEWPESRMSEKLSELKMKTISFVIVHIICHLYILMKSDKFDKIWSTSLGSIDNLCHNHGFPLFGTPSIYIIWEPQLPMPCPRMLVCQIKAISRLSYRAFIEPCFDRVQP